MTDSPSATGKPIVLIILAQTTPPLPELEVEEKNLREAIAQTERCEPVTLESASTKLIFDKLDHIGDRIRIIHYAGHANGSGMMLQSDSSEGPGEKMAYIKGLADRFGKLKNLKLVFLNACATREQVLELSEAGVPAMVATERPVKDDVAQEFSTWFYTRLANDKGIREAFESAQSQVKADSGPDRAIVYGTPEEPKESVSEEWPWKVYGSHRDRLWRLSDTDAAIASEGLAALDSAAVDKFRANFSETRKQLESLAAYKDLHDLLHDVQVKCHQILLPELERENSDDIEWIEIEDAEANLRVLLEKNRDVTERRVVPAKDVNWMEDLKKSDEQLQTSCDDEDIKALKKAEYSIKRILGLRLPLMNTRLNEKARALRLAPLIEGLRKVSEQMTDNEAESDQGSSVGAGLEALDRLNERLVAQVKLHDSWQEVDTELRPIGAGLEKEDTMDLEMVWPDVKPMASGLCEDPADEGERWVRNICSYASKLDEAIESGDILSMQKYFRRYYRETSMRFVVVDKGVKSLCGELKKVGQQLTELLAKSD